MSNSLPASAVIATFERQPIRPLVNKPTVGSAGPASYGCARQLSNNRASATWQSKHAGAALQRQALPALAPCATATPCTDTCRNRVLLHTCCKAIPNLPASSLPLYPLYRLYYPLMAIARWERIIALSLFCLCGVCDRAAVGCSNCWAVVGQL